MGNFVVSPLLSSSGLDILGIFESIVLCFALHSPVGGGATASGTGYSQQGYVLCFLLYFDYLLIGSRITWKASLQIRAVFINSPLCNAAALASPSLCGIPPFSWKRILSHLEICYLSVFP